MKLFWRFIRTDIKNIMAQLSRQKFNIFIMN